MITTIETTPDIVITTTTTMGGMLLGLDYCVRKPSMAEWEWHEAVASHIANHHASMMGEQYPCPTVPPKPSWLPSNEEIDAIAEMPNLPPEELDSIPGDEIPDFWDGPDTDEPKEFVSTQLEKDISNNDWSMD